MFLLDTNVLWELRRLDRTDPGVAAWADALDPSDLFLSAITILEIEIGTLMIGGRDPPLKAGHPKRGGFSADGRRPH